MIRKVFQWELSSGGKPYIIILLLFLLMYAATDYPPERGSPFNIGWTIEEVWWFSFPVVTALAVLLFSYDIDRGLLRTYMLSQTSKTSLFIGKLAAMFLAAYIPLLVSGALILAFVDPALFLANPLIVWHNLWLQLLKWALMMYVMIGFSIFPAILLKKPLYAFVTPYVIIYALLRVELPGNIRDYIPPIPFLFLSNLDPASHLFYLNLLYFWGYVWPSLTIATALLISAYILFLKMEQP